MFQLAEGDFYPGKPKEKSFFDLTDDNADIINFITKQVFPMICINDGYISKDAFPRAQAEICGAFAQILALPCSFEKARAEAFTDVQEKPVARTL